MDETPPTIAPLSRLSMSPLAFLAYGGILTFNLEVDAAFCSLALHLPDEHQHWPILKI